MENNYIKCPKCELNYIKESEGLCSSCKPTITPPKPIGKEIEKDFSKILFRHNYGSNSRDIYEKFCASLKWDECQASQFGWQTWMYAEKADTDRTRDVWFIFHSNYTDSVCESGAWANAIEDDKIYEAYADSFPKPSNNDRIVFVKNKFSGYEFIGVYKIIETTKEGRIYQRISENYPV